MPDRTRFQINAVAFVAHAYDATKLPQAFMRAVVENMIITEDFVSLLNYDDDDFIPSSEVENWERRLGFNLPPQQLS
jgi:hypothetical protein